jgi:hypothetical protein
MSKFHTVKVCRNLHFALLLTLCATLLTGCMQIKAQDKAGKITGEWMAEFSVKNPGKINFSIMRHTDNNGYTCRAATIIP